MSGTQTKSATPAVGYSGKPLSQKLGLNAGQRVRLVNAPANYWTICNFDPVGIVLLARKNQVFDFAHIFATARADLERELPALVSSIDAKGMLWVSWPKKSAKQPTDLTENALRDAILPTGLVDVKVCAVSELWSGLKFVRRRSK